jgi:hypothetical protein
MITQYLNRCLEFIRCANASNGCSGGMLVDCRYSGTLTCETCKTTCLWCKGARHGLLSSCPVERRSWLISIWTKFTAIFSFSSQWKRCPGCGFGIEKTEGCNHMTCTSCRFQFCWGCGGKYRNAFNNTSHLCQTRSFKWSNVIIPAIYGILSAALFMRVGKGPGYLYALIAVGSAVYFNRRLP